MDTSTKTSQPRQNVATRCNACPHGPVNPTIAYHYLVRSSVRKTVSRAKEFDLVFSFYKDPTALVDFMNGRPGGGSTSFEDIAFEYGEISRHSEFLGLREIKNPFNILPQFVCHLDSVNIKRKREIETVFKLQPNSLSSKTLKADIFFVDSNHRPYFVSVKDTEKPSKLGQVSTKTFYGQAHLQGGLHGIELPSHFFPDEFTYRQTGITSSAFKNLSAGDRKFAYFKFNHKKEWLELVSLSKFNAFTQAEKFCEILVSDREILVEFVGAILAGNLSHSENFYILLGEKIVQFSKDIEYLQSNTVKIEIETHQPKKNKSLIVWIIINNERYCLTKIEPSFEGMGTRVNQTKGIVFHFQQFPNEGNHYKKLLLDISQ